jgi:hypothetical protein
MSSRWTPEQLEAHRQGREAKPRAKYGNKKISIDGRTFDSKAEAARYVELKRLQEASLILNLECQVTFPLVVNGELICKYIADFRYVDISGNRVIEDVKGVRTRDYRIKAKLMKALHGISINEICKKRRAS